MVPFKNFLFCCTFLMLVNTAFSKDQDETFQAWQNIGSPQLKDWTGVKADAQNEGASLSLPGKATFRYPQGGKGWYSHGFRREHDGTQDWRRFSCLQADVFVPAGQNLELDITLFTPPANLRQEFLPEAHAKIIIAGNGWRHISMPWSLFDVPTHQSAMFKFIQKIQIEGKSSNGKTGNILLKNFRLALAPQIAFTTPVRGKAVNAGGTADYNVTVTNCTDSVQDVVLSFRPSPFAVMNASVNPAQVRLLPGASSVCTVSVKVPENGVPEGGHETQELTGSSNGTVIAHPLELITAHAVPHPNVLHTAASWAAIKDKAVRYDWAKTALEKYLKDADGWAVPENALTAGVKPQPGRHDYVFMDKDFIQAANASYAWQMSGDKKYAEKVALFLRRLADEKTGYPATFAGTNNDGPQEGEDFQRSAIAYDAVLDAGVLSIADQAQIDRTFRLYMETYEVDFTVGNIGNWSTSESTAALEEALAMGDLSKANRYINGPAGFTDYLSKGVMDDGWWWEVSTGYNLWVASELTQAALACQPWGIDLINLQVPANYSPYAITTPWALDPPYGISFEKWGPQKDNTRSIKKFWDAIPKVADYRGIAFGMNDGHEELVGGQRLELAYYVYRDPAYAAIIKMSNQRDLLYGVPDLPEVTTELYKKSAYAENIGYALLRSQTPDREAKDQIQAVLKIGTQGGFHGHFDRVSLDNLTRYGRSFWNPESIWWGYPNFMYKFYVQTSVNHNMVVVDQKQQEAVPSQQLLFFSGKMMQAAAQETNARWSDPPYLGMQYAPGETPAIQMKKNKQSLPVVTDRKYGELGPLTEKILQRRLMIVTDDYVLLADYLKGNQPHVYDNLFQMKALSSLTSGGKNLPVVKHEGQYNTDPHSAAQCITDADWYRAAGTAKAMFEFAYGPNADNSGTREMLNEPGVLKIDLHVLWPQQQDLMTAMPPETHDEQQWVNYKITGDGKTLASGESGIWILGQQEIDVPVAGLNELTLEVNTSGGKKKALFWANARLIDASGKETFLKDVADIQNIDQPTEKGKDYYGGPIKIAGSIPTGTIATQPTDIKKPAVIHIPLSGKNAVRFKAMLGGDFPFGNEAARRKIFASRVQGKDARFLTVLEPYEKNSMIKSAIATDADHIKVELTDGRVQEIGLENMTGDGSKIKVMINEFKDGKLLRTETTVN